MSESVESSSCYTGSDMPSLIGTSSSELHTLTSGSTASSGESTSSRKPHPSDTSFGLSTLACEMDKLEDFVKLRSDDIDYLAAAREFFQKEPVFRKKFKIRATRRLQISYRSRSGYTQLRRELIRRQPRNKAVPTLVSAMSDLNVNRDE